MSESTGFPDGVDMWYERREDGTKVLGLRIKQLPSAHLQGKKDQGLGIICVKVEIPFLKFNFLLKDNCFTEFCYFLSKLNMNQP